MGYKISTKKGYDFYECSSALQKAVRRNDERTALYFMVELFNSGYAEYVWKRLKIFVSEDIGLAEPTMAAHIHALYSFYQEHLKKKDPKKEERIFLTHAVLSVCRAKKSRLCVWNCYTIWRSHMDTDMPVPDCALDMHNLRGKQKGRGMEHFWYGDDEDTLGGSHLENHDKQDGEDEIKEIAFHWGKRQPKVDWERIERGNRTSNELFE